MTSNTNTNTLNYISSEPNEYIEYKWFIYKKLWKIEKVWDIRNNITFTWWWWGTINLSTDLNPVE